MEPKELCERVHIRLISELIKPNRTQLNAIKKSEIHPKYHRIFEQLQINILQTFGHGKRIDFTNEKINRV